MKATKIMSIVSLMLLAVFAFAVTASALPTVDKVEVDGTTVFENQINRLSIEAGDEFEVDVWLTAMQSSDNVRVEARITALNEDEDTEDETALFDVESNTTYKKTLTLSIPEDSEEDSYELRVTVTDRNSPTETYSYNIVIDLPRHKLAIEDVVLYPENGVVAGQALLASVRLENFGQKDEEDVRVRVSILELGISSTDYISEIESGDEEETEEMYMRVPADAKAGQYQVHVEVSYNDGRDTLGATTVVSVEAAPQKESVVTPVTPVTPAPQTAEKSMLRKVLEGILLVLIGLLVIVAIILAVSKLSQKDE